MSDANEGSLADAWEAHAKAWIAWARAPNHDSYWHFHRDAFFASVPPPGKRTLDIGCGEGRVSRELKARGHHVVGVDVSPTLIAAAREADPSIEVHVADASKELPFPNAHADLAIAFMSPHDVDDLDGFFRECARVLEPAGKLVFAIVHPVNSAGNFEGEGADAPFVMRKDRSYLDTFRYRDRVERDGLAMDFASAHRPLEAFSRALEGAGFLVEAIREPKSPRSAQWQRIPLFMHVRARKA